MQSPLNTKITVEKPWGIFEQFTKAVPVTVKIITINRGESLSLQVHSKRDEFWKILSGQGEITLGDSIKRVRENDEYFIKRNQKHRMKAGDSGIRILEVSFGDFDENDIIRLEDKYNRTEQDKKRG